MISRINILSVFNKWIEQIKKEYIKNGKIESKRFVYSSFKKIYPDFIELIELLNMKDYFREILYCIINDIEYIPLCPICNNLLPLKNFSIGFQKTCSKKCSNILFSTSTEFANKISKAKMNTLIKSKNLNLDNISSLNNYYIIENYCEHGNIKIYKKIFNKISENNESSFCIKCNKNIYNTYNPSELDILSFQNKFKEFYNKYHFSLKYSWWITYYPKYLKILKIYYEKYIDKFDETNPNILAESYYVFMHNLKSRPLCKNSNCINSTHFSSSTHEYTYFCDTHSIGYNSSGKEYELENFIKTLNINYEHNNRNLINKELDFYFPDKNIAIEFNGCWYHSDKFKDKNYHKDKYELCKTHGIQLISVWEDDWEYKQNIVKSIIKSKLGLYDKKIGARKTEIKEVEIKESRIFLNENHLQGYCNAKYRLGLYYNNELIQIMTFGNSRFKKGEFELLRLCTKINYNVIGGSSKLFNYFKNNYITDDSKIISYANCDISNGNIYNKLGFNYIHTTDNWSWFYKNKRINRFNKIRKRSKELNLVKCYTTGTMKFIYNI